MAKGAINLQKESGGVTKITSTDGVSNTEVVLPESGNIASVDTAVTDNAIARYDGTTGKLQNSGVVIDDSGNVGVGVTPSNGWGAYASASIELGSHTAIYANINGSSSVNLSTNVKSANTSINDYGIQYVYTGQGASSYSQYNGVHSWLIAPTGTSGNAITWTSAMTLNASGNLLVGTTIDNGVNKLQVNGSISASPPSFGIQQQVNNHRKLYCFYKDGGINHNRLKLTISGDPTYLSFVLNIVYSNLHSASNQSAIREYSFKRVAQLNTTNFSEIGTGLGSTVTVISSNVVTGGYEVVLGFNAGGYPQFDIEIINQQPRSIGTITGEFLTV